MASPVTLPLSVVLGAIDKFSAPMQKVATRLDAFAAKANKVGKTLTTSVTLPTAAFLGLTIKAGAEFERAMGQVAAATGRPRSELQDLQEVVEKLGESPPFNASQVAGAAAALAREGKSAAEILALLPNVSNLAAANAIGLGEAVEIVADSLDAFNLEAVQSARVVDLLTAASSKTGGLGNLVQSIDAITPAASAVNASLEDSVTVLVALNAAGAEGTRAAAALQAAYVRLGQGAAGTQETLAKFGLGKADVFDQAGKLRPLSALLGELADRGARASDFVSLFGAKAGPALAAAAASGSRGLRELGGELERSGGEAARRAGLATEGAGYAFERLGGSIEKLQLAIAQSGLLEWTAKIVDAFAGWISRVAESNPELLQLATVVALVAAAVGPVILIVGQVASAISAVITVVQLAVPAIAALNAVMAANPVGLVVLAIAGLVAAIYFLWKHWDKVFGFLRATWELFTLPIRTFISYILDAFPALDRIVPDWIKNIIRGKTFTVPGSGAEIGSNRLAGAAGAGAPAKTETKVAVDFSNVPRGVNVEREGRGTAPVDLSVGYAMAGG